MVILSWLFPAVLYFLIAVILKQIASEDIFITFKISTVFVFQLMPCIGRSICYRVVTWCLCLCFCEVSARFEYF